MTWWLVYLPFLLVACHSPAPKIGAEGLSSLFARMPSQSEVEVRLGSGKRSSEDTWEYAMPEIGGIVWVAYTGEERRASRIKAYFHGPSAPPEAFLGKSIEGVPDQVKNIPPPIDHIAGEWVEKIWHGGSLCYQVETWSGRLTSLTWDLVGKHDH